MSYPGSPNGAGAISVRPDPAQFWAGAAATAVVAALIALVAYLSMRVEQQSLVEEAQPADVILVLGAAEYRGRPSPVLRSRLDHAVELFRRKLAPRVMTTGGAGGAGNTGFPNLVDDDWLWGGNIDQIYATIQHGIRNADDNSRQSLMPRYGADGLLTGPQVAAVTDYVLSLSGRGKASAEGTKIWQENCAACHQADGKGNQELGSPNLTDGIWLYGGDRESIYRSIFYARHGSMPAGSGRLDDATIKMLAIYVHALGGGR